MSEITSNVEAPSLVPGEARCPGPSAQDILAQDKVPPPDFLREESYSFLGNEPLDPKRYTSQEFFNLEMERMWKRTWQWACREEHIPEPGDYYVYDIGDISIIVTRAEDGEIRAFYNVCQHRGTMLRSHQGVGHAAELRCPFHGWSWSLDGTLKNVPCRWDFPQVKDEEYGLAAVNVGLWGGFVFINMDPSAPPLEEYIAPLQEHFRNADMENRHTFLHVQQELPSNWKAAAEAFVEGYHIMETHPQLLETFGDANTQYDFYGDHVSRFVELAGVSSPHIDPVPPEEMLRKMFVGGTSTSGAEYTVPEGESVRSVMAGFVRQAMESEYGLNVDRYSDSELIDPNQYTLFPNMFLFPGVGFPMVYRVRPAGNSPDRCHFELLFLRPNPKDGEAPEPPEPHILGEYDSLADVPGLEPGLAMAMSQDLGNLRAQQRGYKFMNRGLTLGNYQEVRIRHFHQTLDKYLAHVE